MVGPAGPHLHRGDGAPCRLAARRDGRNRNRRLRVRHRTAGSADAAPHPAAVARRERVGRPGAPPDYDGRVPADPSDRAEDVDPDLLIDFAKVTLRRGGKTLVGPVTWA